MPAVPMFTSFPPDRSSDVECSEHCVIVVWQRRLDVVEGETLLEEVCRQLWTHSHTTCLQAV